MTDEALLKLLVAGNESYTGEEILNNLKEAGYDVVKVNQPLICGVDIANGKDKTVAMVMERDKLVATFEGKTALLKAAAYARQRNLKMNLVIDTADLEKFYD